MTKSRLPWTSRALALFVGFFSGFTSSALHAQSVVELPSQDRSVTATLEEVYSVGSMMGEEWETFASVEDSDLGFDAAGNLYILDRAGARVVVVGPSGELIRVMGRTGDGPGEFKTPKAIAVHPDGSFAVYDRGHFAIMHFGPEGESLGQQSVGTEGVPGRRILAGAEGSVISVGGSQLMVTGDGEPALEGPLRAYPARGQGSTTVLNPAGAPEGSFPFTMEVVTAAVAGGVRSVAFKPRASFGVRTDGTVVLSDSVTYRVALLNPSGTVVKLLRRQIEPRRITASDQARERAYRLDQIENDDRPLRALGVGGSPAQGQAQYKEVRRRGVERLEFAEEFPVLAQVAVDGEGRVWAERTGDDPNGPGPIDVIDSDDRYLGTISGNAMSFPFAFGPGGLVAYVEKDGLDVPTVVVKRVRLGEG